ncbi:hypothetical protein [Corynebacterium sp. H130]|uniref:hypothetical protein n=1 Tax=Corynebacterium sp. H130 TaxID=3133444 RepID=UPI00309A2350
MRKLIASIVVIVGSLFVAPLASAQPGYGGYMPLAPGEIARENAKSPIQKLQDQALMSTMQASFLGMAVPDAPQAFGPLGECVTRVSGSAEIQPVQMVATWVCLATNPSLNPLPKWYM